jgi:hypothetical protein
MTTHESVADQLRRDWFSSVYEISDIDLQRRTWLDPLNRNPHWSYVEFRGKYPDREQLEYALKHGWLTADEFGLLSDLRRVLDGHKPPGRDYYDLDGILADPAWHSVVEAAERVRQQLLATTADGQERDMLLGVV